MKVVAIWGLFCQQKFSLTAKVNLTMPRTEEHEEPHVLSIVGGNVSI